MTSNLAKRKKKINKRFIIKTLIYIVLLLISITVAILVPEKEDKLKNPYRESIGLRQLIADILERNNISRVNVLEVTEEKTLNNHKIIFSSFNIILNDEIKYNKLSKEITDEIIKTGTIFSKSNYELNSQKTTTLYCGFDNYITSFIAISFCEETIKEKDKPVIAIIIDDMGNDIGKRFKTLLKLKGLTFSVLPGCRNSHYTVKKGLEAGHEIMLHCPMEPINAELIPKSDKTMLLANMSDQEVEQTLLNNLASLPPVSGLNNHMGSKFTQNGPKMEIVMNILKSRKMYYVDSVTIQNTKGWKTADKMGVPHIKRDVFLDHKNNKAYIKKQISKLIRTAFKKGYAVGIGHIRAGTPATLETAYQEFKALGIEVVPVSYIIENQENLRTSGDFSVTDEVEDIINEYLDH